MINQNSSILDTLEFLQCRLGAYSPEAAQRLEQALGLARWAEVSKAPRPDIFTRPGRYSVALFLELEKYMLQIRQHLEIVLAECVDLLEEEEIVALADFLPR